jgi:hypothetical protein
MVAEATRDAAKIKRRKKPITQTSIQNNSNATLSSSSVTIAAARAAAAAAVGSTTFHEPIRATSLPTCWESAMRLGSQMMACPLLSCKTPVSSSIIKGIPPQYTFTPSMLISSQKSRGLPIGLVIDLTGKEHNTNISTRIRHYIIHYTLLACTSCCCCCYHSAPVGFIFHR